MNSGLCDTPKNNKNIFVERQNFVVFSVLTICWEAPESYRLFKFSFKFLFD